MFLLRFNLVVFTIAITSSTTGLSDFHQYDCRRCSPSGRLAIERLFQIDDCLYVQLQQAKKWYHLVDMQSNKSSQRRAAVDGLFLNDFTQVRSVLDFGPLHCDHNNCADELFRQLRHRIVVIGHGRTFPTKVIYKAYQKSYHLNGSLILSPLDSITTLEVLKHSQLLNLPPPENLQSAIYLRPFGLTLATYKDNSSFIQLLHQPSNPFLLRPIRVTDFLSANAAASGAFYWSDQLFVLSEAGVLSVISGEYVLREVVAIQPDKIGVKSVDRFSRFSTEQFFKCNCSAAQVHLSGINEFFQLYINMADNNKGSQNVDSKVLEELLHNFKVSIYKELYQELTPSNESLRSDHLKMRHLRACLQSMLANESRMADHYHGLELSMSRHFHSDTDFQLAPATTGQLLDNHSQLLNITTLCIEAGNSKFFYLWYLLVLALYIVLGGFVFCVALCSGACVDDDETNSNELIFISGVGRDLMQKVPQHTIRLEDFVYLMAPHQKALLNTRPVDSKTIKTGASFSSTGSVATPKNAKPAPVNTSKLANLKSVRTQAKSLKTNANFELSTSRTLYEKTALQSKVRSPSGIPFATSVNQADSELKTAKSPRRQTLLSKLKLKQQVASIKSKMIAKSVAKDNRTKLKQKSLSKSSSLKLVMNGKSDRR